MLATVNGSNQATPSLKRAIGPWLLFAFVLGDVLGGGIYVLVGQVAGEVGGAAWLAFLVALALASLTAASYAHLAARFPFAGGASLYVREASGSGFLAFMAGFAVICSGITSAATLARAFAGDYLDALVGSPGVWVAVAFLVALTALNLRGISESVKTNVLLTAVELGGLLIVVAAGLAALASGDADPGRAMEVDGSGGVGAALAAVLGGSALAFYALIGFEDSANVAEETTEQRHAYPRALLGGLAVAGVLYLLIAALGAAVVPPTDLRESTAPLLEIVAASPISVPSEAFAVIGLIAITNGALINLIMASRLLYGMSRERIVPRGLSRLLPGRRTPVNAIAATAAAAIALALTGDLATLARTTVALLLFVFIAVNVSAIALRRTPSERPAMHLPTVVPVLGALGALAMLTQIDGATWLRALALLGLGLVAWFGTRLAARVRGG